MIEIYWNKKYFKGARREIDLHKLPRQHKMRSKITLEFFQFSIFNTIRFSIVTKFSPKLI